MRSGNHTYFVETYGCQMNKAESEALEAQLVDAGWSPTTDSTKADLIILNTCSVRKTAENRIYGRLGHYRHLKTQRNFKLAVVGCMSERLKDKLFNECRDIDIIVGSFQKHRFVDVLEEVIQGTARKIVAVEWDQTAVGRDEGGQGVEIEGRWGVEKDLVVGVELVEGQVAQP